MTARTIQEVQEKDGPKIELVGRAEGDPEFYVEGIHGMNVSGPMIKFNYYTLGIDSSPTNQRRESVCRMVMAAPQFFQMVDFMTQLAQQMRQAAANAGAAPAPTNPAAKN